MLLFEKKSEELKEIVLSYVKLYIINQLIKNCTQIQFFAVLDRNVSAFLKIINSKYYETSCNILDKHQMLLVKKAYERKRSSCHLRLMYVI